MSETMGAMYPKVKVREDAEQNIFQDGTEVLLIRVIESLSLETHFPQKDFTAIPVSPPPHARITDPHFLRTQAPSNGAKVTGRSQQYFEDDNRPNIRASSVPRPRAVLSSPDNDSMIGNINKRFIERRPLPKSQNSRQNALAERKPVAQSPVNRTKPSKEDSGSSISSHKARQVSSIAAVARHRLPVRREKISTKV